MRIYSNYSNDEAAAIEKAAAERGYSLSAFQRICLLKEIGIKQPVDEQALINKMHSEIKKLAPESTFVISALLGEEYYECSKAQQIFLSKYLKRFAEENPNTIRANGKIKTSTQYIKL